MDKSRNCVQAAVLCIFMAVLLIGVYVSLYDVPDYGWELKIIYGEFHENRNGGTSQLFYAESGEAFSEERSMIQNIWEQDQSVTFELPEISLRNIRLRFDPFMNDHAFSVYALEFRQGGELWLTIAGDEFRQYVADTEHCEYDQENRRFIPQSEDPVLYLDTELNERAIREWREGHSTYQERAGIVAGSIAMLYAASGLLLLAGQKRRMLRPAGSRWGLYVADVVLCMGAALLYAVYFLMHYFGNVRLEELLFLMNTAVEGTNLSSFYPLFFAVGGIIIIGSALVFLNRRRMESIGRQRGYALWVAGMGVLCFVSAIWIGFQYIDVASYYRYVNDRSGIYEEYYVDARDVELVFPQKERNLIYIYLESMEMSYADEGVGGAMQENYIPELTELGLENIDFSDVGRLNGAHVVSGASFTSGAIVAQTSGVPIHTSMFGMETVNNHGGEVGCLIPGAWTLGDVLEEAGYHQVFLIGSDGNFGARRQYFEGHGDFEVYDYYTALENHRIPEDYYVWWGYEDEKLIAFAKEELLELAAEEEPFNFMMLTVDTHFTEGYQCRLCEHNYDMQYSNVIACSSRQIAAFVEWISQQDFYENTTVVVSGDHLTMDTEYTNRMMYGNNFDRRTYVSIINPAEGCTESGVKREYTTLDLYPTTLAALGVEIDGDRLGLGVNLFAGIPTLYEEYGGEYLDAELLKRSDLYADQLVYGEEHLAVDDPKDGES